MLLFIAFAALAAAEYLDERALHAAVYETSMNWLEDGYEAGITYFHGPELMFDHSNSIEDDTDWPARASENVAWVEFDFSSDPICLSDVHVIASYEQEGVDEFACRSFIVETAATRRGPWTAVTPTLACSPNSTVEHELDNAFTMKYGRVRICACDECAAACAATGGTAKKRQQGSTIGVSVREVKFAGFHGTCEGTPTPAPTAMPNSVTTETLQSYVKKTSNNFLSTEQEAIEQLADWDIEDPMIIDDTNQMVQSNDKQVEFYFDLGDCMQVDAVALYGDHDHNYTVDERACRDWQVYRGYSLNDIDADWTPLLSPVGNCHRDWLLPDEVPLSGGVGARYLKLVVCACYGCSTNESSLACRMAGDSTKVTKGVEFGEFKLAAKKSTVASACNRPATTSSGGGDGSTTSTTAAGSNLNNGSQNNDSSQGLSTEILIVVIVCSILFLCCVVAAVVLASVMMRNQRRRRGGGGGGDWGTDGYGGGGSHRRASERSHGGRSVRRSRQNTSNVSVRSRGGTFYD